MCGVSACENMQKRVSHGETVRVGSSAIIKQVVILSESGRHRAPVLLCMCFSDVGKAAVCAAVPNNAFHQCFKNVLAL